jgi:methyl coenzyme M reductase subunit C-like uncharacterized protein (methanogenesis marker protein 7)
MIIFSDDKIQQTINESKIDLINTIRIQNLEVYNNNQEIDIKDKPEIKEYIEDLRISIYFSKN